MILVVDIGNTRIKWGRSRDGSLAGVDGVLLGAPGDRDAWEPKWLALERPARIVIANVAGAAIADRLCAWTQRVWGLTPEIIQSSKSFQNVSNGYRTPERLGVDRWVALIAGYHITRGPALVVSCGTAVTVDVVNRDGEHLGGQIIPGLRLMRDALSRGTRQIEPVEEEAEAEGILGHDTDECINIGSVQAVAALVERTASAMTALIGEAPSVVLCGGDAARILPWVAGPSRHEPHLVLRGLLIVALSRQGI